MKSRVKVDFDPLSDLFPTTKSSTLFDDNEDNDNHYQDNDDTCTRIIPSVAIDDLNQFMNSKKQPSSTSLFDDNINDNNTISNTSSSNIIDTFDIPIAQGLVNTSNSNNLITTSTNTSSLFEDKSSLFPLSNELDIKTINKDKISFKSTKSISNQSSINNINETSFHVSSHLQATGNNNSYEFNMFLHTNNTLTQDKQEDDDGIFVPTKKVVNEELFPLNLSTSTNPMERRSMNIMRVPTEEDDDDLDINNLMVSKILERETDLDYNSFGKEKVSETQKTSMFSNDDLDLSNFDTLNDLERNLSSTSMKVNSSSINVSNTIQSIGMEVQDVDLTSMNLDDYINQQSNSSGGLFD